MKGQQEVISIILISGILIGVVGSVYFWGVPLIQKNKDVALLDNSEKFIKNLNSKIKFIANNGGRDQIRIGLPGIVRLEQSSNIVEFIVDTEGTIYASDAEIPLGKNTVCASAVGVFGLNDPETICVKSLKITENSYRTTYTLHYVKLENSDLGRNFEIKLTGNEQSGGEASTIVFEDKGNTETADNGRTLINTLIEISII